MWKFQSCLKKFNFFSASPYNFCVLIQLPELIQICRRVALNHLFANWSGLNHKEQWSGTRVHNYAEYIIVYPWNTTKCENERYTWTIREITSWGWGNPLFYHVVKYFMKRKLEGRDLGMSEVTGTSQNWNASFQALTEKNQAVGGGDFISIRLHTAYCQKTTSV